MKIWTTAAALVLLIQSASAGYSSDWDSDGLTVTSSSNDVKQSFGGVSSEAGTVKAGVYGGGNDDGGDDDNDGDNSSEAPAAAAPVVAPAPTPETEAPSPVVTPAPAPAPILKATGNDDDDGETAGGSGDDTDNDGDDDGDDAPRSAVSPSKPYEQNDNYDNAKQTGQTTTGDSKPNVSNGGVNLYPYTQEIRDYIVETHNWARGNLAPSQAANMRQLSWDESLAIEASELVETCIFEHDTENYAYGQNLMYGGYSLDKTMIDGWMDGWVKNEISEYDRAGTGYMDLDHASAVLWANSFLVGCASKMCPNGYLSACNYYTPGNWQGEAAYIPGPTCSQCPAKAPYCDATGKLCTADPTGATPTSKPNQSVVQTAAPASAPAPTPAKTSGRPASAPAPTPAKTTANGGQAAASPKVAPAPTPKVTIPNELFCV
ncbi:Peptidase inhibitor 16 isoform x3 [Globisporangium polare]